MIVRRFLAWAQSAPEDPRVSAAAALTRAFLSDETCAAERCDAEAALTLLLDDPSPAVRLAVAETLAESEFAPRHIVSVLSSEPGRTGEVLLEHSPVLGEVDLIERIATGDAGAQIAVARREGLTGPVAAALAEVGEAEAVLALALNRTAECPAFAVTRMIERYGADPRVRDALERRQLSITQRYALQIVSAKAGSAGVDGQASWRVERAEREAMERAALLLASQDERARADMIDYLRGAGHLTAGLLLRAAAQADPAFVADALASLSKMSMRRVTALVAESKGSGFAAVCAKAGLSQAVTTALRAALDAHREIAARGFPVGAASRSREACRSTLQACTAAGLDTHDVASMFRRLELEFSREAARVAAEKLLEQHRLETEGPLLLGAPMLQLPAPEAEALADVQDAEHGLDAVAAPSVAEQSLAVAEANEPAPADLAAVPVVEAPALSEPQSALDQAFNALKAALEPFGPVDGPSLDAPVQPAPAAHPEMAGMPATPVRDWAAVLASAFDLPGDAASGAAGPRESADENRASASLSPDAPAADGTVTVGASFLAELNAPAGAAFRLVAEEPIAGTAAAVDRPVVEIPSIVPPPAPEETLPPSPVVSAKPDLSAWERVFDRAEELASLDAAAGHELQREAMADMLREAVEAMQRRGGAVEVSRDRLSGMQAA